MNVLQIEAGKVQEFHVLLGWSDGLKIDSTAFLIIKNGV
jgi:hypothetical protein